MQQDGVYCDMTSNILARGRRHSLRIYSNSTVKGQNAYERQDYDEEAYSQYYDYEA